MSVGSSRPCRSSLCLSHPTRLPAACAPTAHAGGRGRPVAKRPQPRAWGRRRCSYGSARCGKCRGAGNNGWIDDTPNNSSLPVTAAGFSTSQRPSRLAAMEPAMRPGGLYVHATNDMLIIRIAVMVEPVFWTALRVFGSAPGPHTSVASHAARLRIPAIDAVRAEGARQDGPPPQAKTSRCMRRAPPFFSPPACWSLLTPSTYHRPTLRKQAAAAVKPPGTCAFSMPSGAPASSLGLPVP